MIVWLIKSILFFLLFIGIILIIMIFVPFKYSISGNKSEEVQFHINISWLFSLIKICVFFQSGLKFQTDFFVFGHPVNIEDSQKKEKQSPIKKTKKNSKKKKTIHPSHILNKGLFKSIAVLLNDFIRWLKPKSFKLNGKLGFEDPYHTSILSCFLYSFKEPLQKNGMHMIPIFEQAIFEADFEIEGKLTIAVLLFIIMKFTLSKQVRQIILYEIDQLVIVK